MWRDYKFSSSTVQYCSSSSPFDMLHVQLALIGTLTILHISYNVFAIECIRERYCWTDGPPVQQSVEYMYVRVVYALSRDGQAIVTPTLITHFLFCSVSPFLLFCSKRFLFFAVSPFLLYLLLFSFSPFLLFSFSPFLLLPFSPFLFLPFSTCLLFFVSIIWPQERSWFQSLLFLHHRQVFVTATWCHLCISIHRDRAPSRIVISGCEPLPLIYTYWHHTTTCR